MFIALKTVTESNPNGPPFIHPPGAVLERWAEWPYRVRVALLGCDMAEEVPDVAPDSLLKAVEMAQADPITTALINACADKQAFVCELCEGRVFESKSALKRHTTRAHR